MNDDSIATHMHYHVLSVLLTGPGEKKKKEKWPLSTLINMAIFYHIILTFKVLAGFLLEWAGFCELLGCKSFIQLGNTAGVLP